MISKLIFKPPKMPESKEELLKKFGAALKAKRVSLGISQEELAHRSGLDRTYIGGAERGERNVSLINLVKIGNALETNLTELLRGIFDEHPTSPQSAR